LLSCLEEPKLDISDLDVVPIEDFNPGQIENDFLDNVTSNTKSEGRKPKKIDRYPELIV